MKRNILRNMAMAAGMAAVLMSCNVTNTGSTKPSDIKTVNKACKVRDFEKIAIAGSFDVVYTQDSTCHVTIQAPEEKLEKMSIRSEDGTLYVEVRRDPKSMTAWLGHGQDLGDVKVLVGSVDLVTVSIAGSGTFDAPSHVDTDNMRLNIAGSGSISFSDMICNTLKGEIAGSGDIGIGNVKTASAKFSIAGSGNIEARFNDSGDVKCDIAGSGNINLRGTVETCSNNVSGSGVIDIKELIRKSKIH